MVIFKDEKDLVNTLNDYFGLIKKVINGETNENQFINQNSSFYYLHALDGHESDEEEKILFTKYHKEIGFLKDIQEKIFNNICSDEDSKKEIFITHGRINLKEAINQLREKYYQTFEEKENL